MAGKFQILSLSGGGFLGFYTISVLAELEAAAGRPIAECFDLIAGTSVGGIVGLGLAAEVSADEIREAFEVNGTKIFSNRVASKSRLANLLDLGRIALKPKYDGKGLRNTINKIVGESTLVSSLKHRTIVPAINVTKGQVQVFKTAHHPSYKRDYKLRIADVAMATSAAPTYFPLAEVGDCLFVDGGLYANSPDMLALHEAAHFLEVPIDEIHMLSIGTTTAEYSFAHQDGRNLGALGWMSDQRLTSVMIAAQQQSVDFMVGHRLRDRYVRLDRAQSKAQERELGLDVATEAARKTIRGLATSTVQDCIVDRRIESMLSHRPAAPTFYHPR